jgi:heat-inducible transcriptional repressor
MLADRTRTILRLLVDEYISTASPVPSEGIARRAPIKISPATVRNEMSELEGQGYILRYHVSSGGVPSDKGYRFYIDSIQESSEPPKEARRRIHAQLMPAARDVEARTQQAAMVLANTVGSMAIVTVPRASASRFKYLQLVHLQEFLALHIVVLSEARLIRQFLPLSESILQPQLTEVANRLNDIYEGLTYAEVESKDVSLSAFEKSVVKDTVSVLRDADNETTVAHYVDGLRLLFSKPEFVEGRLARGVAEVLEDPTLLKTLLSKAPKGSGPVVFIGQENAEEPLRTLGVILCRYGIPQEASGILSVVGPTRMDYPAVMGNVKFLASYLSNLMVGDPGQR